MACADIKIRRAVRLCTFALCLVGLFWSASAGLAESITVERGDVLRIEVVDASDFSREVFVDANGAIALPHVDVISVAGQDIAEIRATISKILADEGLIRNPRVLVEVAAYRPVYVGGAVEAPGAIDFVPGLTGRQAVVAAGGLRRVSETTGVTPEALLAVHSARRATALAYGQVVARIVRITAELEDAVVMPQLTDRDVPLAPEEFSDIGAVEVDILSDRRAAKTATRAHTERLQALVELELETLERQAELQAKEAQSQQADVEAARSMVERGLMPRPRLQEMLRDQSALTRTRLDTDAFAARARQTAETIRYEARRAHLRSREELHAALQVAIRERARFAAELEQLDLRLMAGTVADQQVEAAPAVRLVVYRITEDGSKRITSDLDKPIRPGDVLDVVMSQLNAADVPTQ